MAVMGFFAAAPSGLIVAMVQDTVRPDQRATGAAGIILTPALIGTGIAPALIGYLSDAYAPAAGLDSLRLALLTIVLIVAPLLRSEEHTSELQSLMRISYAVFCLKKKNSQTQINYDKSQ